MNNHSRILLIFSGILGAGSVAMGAVGAHAIYQTLLAKHLVETYGKAVDYAMYGALALLGVAVLQQLLPKARFFLSGYLIAFGSFCFSGTIFIYIFWGIKNITMFTPWGGTSLIIAWVLLALLAIFNKSSQ